MAEARFVVGIDLGTTHSALAAALLERPRLYLLSVPQLIAPGEVDERELLPSFLYLPSASETSDAGLALPFPDCPEVIGEYARKRGAKNPNQLVASAKSWICHGGVNRRAAILPWSAPEEQPHISPYQAQVAYLRHLARTWNQKHPDAPLAEQDVVVTVPASFDESARVLTSDAAAEAGLGEVRLLEEPQAAFYDYLGALAEDEDARQAAHQEAARDVLAAARLILVVDLGGGTTDLTLLRVVPGSKDDHSTLPTMERIAVGGHLMLGGDNMDAALAFFALTKSGLARPSDASLWSSLVQSARDAKESLLSANPPASAVISYQGRGSSLVASTKSIRITREEAELILLDGCFPRTGPRDVAERTARVGLTTLGLPYTTDTAVPRHICAFLRRHATAALDAGARVHDGLPQPDLLLLNGGVFQAPAIVSRLLEVLAGWFNGAPPVLLPHTSLNTAVARGAVRYGMALRGLGTVVRGGSAKAYYVGIEHQGRKWGLCVAPRNGEPGTRVNVPDRLFQLRLNEPVSFELFSYTGDRVDAPGVLVELTSDDDRLEPMAPLQTLLRGRKDAQQRETFVSVSIESFLDEAGNLRLSLVSAELPPRRWTLDFVVREAASTAPPDAKAAQKTKPVPSLGARAGTLTAGTEAVAQESTAQEVAFQPDPRAPSAASKLVTAFTQSAEDAAGRARGQLEDMLGPRGQWSVGTCRVIADACLEVESKRAQSEAHELSWLRILSWALRPGFGARGDRARLEHLCLLEPAGPTNPSKANWGEWWLLWRRIAPGLSAARQLALYERVRPWLSAQGKRPKGPPLLGPVEMMRMVAALERLPAEAKVAAGARFLEQSKKLGSYWPLGRVGARVLFHGDPANVVPPEQAERWLEALLALDWYKAEGAAFAAASIARVTADRALDVSAGLRERVAQRLTEVKADAIWVDMVLRPTHLDPNDIKRVLGDSLPPGLSLT